MTKTEEICIKWLNKNFNYMEPFIAKGYDGYVFHMKNGKCILQYNKINGYLHISYGEIWSFLESMFGMSFKEIRELTKIWSEQYYVAKVNPITPCIPHVKDDVEEQYKMRVMTTHIDFTNRNTMVEEQYKMNVVTAMILSKVILIGVEEQYKMNVGAAYAFIDDKMELINEEYKMKVETTTVDMASAAAKVEEEYRLMNECIDNIK
jgi:hypothetical protein